jgi:hypothetical protein
MYRAESAGDVVGGVGHASMTGLAIERASSSQSAARVAFFDLPARTGAGPKASIPIRSEQAAPVTSASGMQARARLPAAFAVNIALTVSSQNADAIREPHAARHASVIVPQLDPWHIPRRRCFRSVFQGRCNAILVEKNAYLLELAPYVVLDPVRARMVTAPAAWPWSSFRAMIGTASIPPWLRTGWILGQFANRRRPAVTAYIEFVRASVSAASIWSELRGQIYLGGETFVKRLQQSTAGSVWHGRQA